MSELTNCPEMTESSGFTRVCSRKARYNVVPNGAWYCHQHAYQEIKRLAQSELAAAEFERHYPGGVAEFQRLMEAGV